MQSNKNNAQVILALDVGGTFIKSALFCGKELQHFLPQVPSCSGGSAEEIAAALQTTVESVGEIDGIGIAIPGPFDYRNGISLMDHKFGAIKGHSLREFLPDVPIRFLHDANAFLLGERQDQRRIGGVTLGTGFGAAVMIDGELQINELGSPATEASLWQKPFRGTTVEDALALREFDKTLAESAKAGTEYAQRKWMEFGDTLSEILTPWCNRFELETIVIGGQIARDFELFKTPLAHLPVKRSGLGDAAALYGVASLFMKGWE